MQLCQAFPLHVIKLVGKISDSQPILYVTGSHIYGQCLTFLAQHQQACISLDAL